MKLKGENAIDFANRVKNKIAQKGGLVDLLWDGNLKRQQVAFSYFQFMNTFELQVYWLASIFSDH